MCRCGWGGNKLARRPAGGEAAPSLSLLDLPRRARDTDNKAANGNTIPLVVISKRGRFQGGTVLAVGCAAN